jgi:hypothetical protein
MPRRNLEDRSFVRWTEADYLRIVCAALPLVRPGMEWVDALLQVQETLVEASKQQRSREDLQRKADSESMARAIEQAKRLSPASREEQVEALKRDRILSELEYPAKIFWSDLEWALVWRRVQYWRRDLGDKRSVPDMAIHAQMIELPVIRWRKKTVLQATYGKGPHGVEANFRRIAPLADKLLKGIPFEPGKRETLTLPDLHYDDTPEAEEPATLAPPPAPEPAPKSLLDLAQAGRQAAEPQRPQEPPQPAPAPIPLASLEKRPVDPLEAFAGHLVGLMRSAFDAIATHQAASLELNVRRISEQLTESVAQALDARMQQLVPATVKAALEENLGGPVEVPEMALEPLNLDLAGAGLATRVKLDVLGLFPKQITEVKRALNGYADGVRFVPPDQLDRWQPREGGIVIGNLKVVNRSIEDRCRGAHVQLHRVYGASTAVLKAIQEVYAQAGADLPLHH